MRRLEQLRQHKKPIVSRLFVRSDLTCTICMCEFGDAEDIVELDCHSSHLFHYECLESWV